MWGGGQRWPRHPRHQGAPAGSRRERAPRGPETRWAPAWWRGPARWAGDLGWRMAAGGGGRVGSPEGEVGGAGGADAGTELLPRAALPPRRGMLPGPPRRWDAGREAPEERGPSAGSDSGEAWTSGEEALGEPGTSPQDSPQPWSRRPSWTQREQLLARSPPGLAAEHSPGTPGRPWPCCLYRPPPLPPTPEPVLISSNTALPQLPFPPRWPGRWPPQG